MRYDRQSRDGILQLLDPPHGRIKLCIQNKIFYDFCAYKYLLLFMPPIVTVSEAASSEHYTYVWSATDTDFDFDVFEQQYRQMYTDPRPFFIVADGSMLFEMDAGNLERMIDLLQELRPLTATQVIGSAIIISNHVMYTMIALIMSKYTHVSPMKIVKSSPEALLFLKSLIESKT
jgi:hypothetical protein